MKDRKAQQPRRLAASVLLLAAGAMIVTGCQRPGESGDSTSQPGTAGQSATTPAQQLEDSGEQMENVTVAFPGSLSNLHPGKESGILNYYAASLTMEGLLSFGADGSIQPGIAQEWSQPDDTTYRFVLDPEARFQDGSLVTAQDVVSSVEQAQDVAMFPGIAAYLAPIETVEAEGDDVVVITLSEPQAGFEVNLTSAGALFVAPATWTEEHADSVGTPSSLLMGTGPYRVTEYAPDSQVVFEASDEWRGEAPAAKKITIKFIPDENTRLLAAQSGEVDMAFNVPLPQAQQWEDVEDMRVEFANDLSYVGLNFDTRVAPFDDPQVRKAVAHAVNRNAIVERLLHGHAESATAMMTPESIASEYSPEEARVALGELPQYDFDLDAAKEMLAESDHPDGFTTEMIFPSTGPQLGTAAQSLSQNLQELGITLNVKEVPVEEWLATLGDGEHGISYMWYFSTTGDPAEVPAYMLGADNISGYSNDEVTAALAEANAATDDPQARIDALLEAERLQAEDAVNVPLWWGQSATALSDELGMRENTPFVFVSGWGDELFKAVSP